MYDLYIFFLNQPFHNRQEIILGTVRMLLITLTMVS